MNVRVYRAMLATGSLLFALSLVAQTTITPTNAPGGKLQFEQAIYDFGKIKSGSVINHIYFFTNVGTAPVTISHVQPSCGCTATTDWTKTLEPGQTGKIPVQFNSASFNGPVNKTIVVSSSASALPVVLQLKGELWKPIDVNPQFAVINILPDSEGGSTTVRIINNTQEQLKFSDPEVSNRAFVAAIESSTNNPGKEYFMTISAARPLPQGNVQAQVTVKTGSTNLPVLAVTAWANVQPAFVVMPGQITLPAGPLKQSVTPSILISNNSTNSLEISEATINVDNVKIDVRETQPGRMFSVALTFPEGYENPKGKQIIFTAKSNSETIPMVKVPVAQMARSLAVPAAQPPPKAEAHTALPRGLRQGATH